MKKNLYTRLVYARNWFAFGRIAYLVLKALGCEIPKSVVIGSRFHLVHGGIGVILHPSCVIGDDVTIYQGVTLGRGDTYRTATRSLFRGIRVGNGAIIGPGAKVLGTSDVLTIGEGTVIGANAVLQHSTAPGEVWAGVPARCIGHRSDPEFA